MCLLSFSLQRVASLNNWLKFSLISLLFSNHSPTIQHCVLLQECYFWLCILFRALYIIFINLSGLITLMIMIVRHVFELILFLDLHPPDWVMQTQVLTSYTPVDAGPAVDNIVFDVFEHILNGILFFLKSLILRT